MSKTTSTGNIWYDSEEDILGIQVSSKKYWKSVEIAPNVVVDISKTGEITAFEISNAKKSLTRKDASLILSGANKRR
jgi:uncharacterized protein YuzE